MSTTKKAAAGARPCPPRPDEPVYIFVSYSHEDKVWFERIRPVLKFPDTKVVHVWHDTKLEPGDHWDVEIKAELKRMDVFVCLVSYYFLESEYIQTVELPEAMAPVDGRKVDVLPLPLCKMNLKREHPGLNACQCLLRDGKCWRDFYRDSGDFQDAHEEIRTGLRQAIERVRARRTVK